MPKESFDVSIEGFSGPLDLLCHLVESRQMQASRIKVTHLVRIYGAYLARTRAASVETIAEFFFMVAGLLLEKTRSLLPEPVRDTEEGGEDHEDPGLDEEAFLETLARYRPYREAARWLWERREREMRFFRRCAGDDEKSEGSDPDPSGSGEAPPAEDWEYDIGDLYLLSRVWWGLFERYSRSRSRDRAALWDEVEDAGWSGIPEALPEGSQIQTRIGELEDRLAHEAVLSLEALCGAARSIKLLVVTLLALLEMCRMGKIRIEQETLFADVTILAKA